MCTEEEERGREGGREGGRDGWFSSGIGQTYTTRHVRMSDADIRSTLHYAQFTRKWLFRMTRSPQHTHTHTHRCSTGSGPTRTRASRSSESARFRAVSKARGRSAAIFRFWGSDHDKF